MDPGKNQPDQRNQTFDEIFQQVQAQQRSFAQPARLATQPGIGALRTLQQAAVLKPHSTTMFPAPQHWQGQPPPPGFQPRPTSQSFAQSAYGGQAASAYPSSTSWPQQGNVPQTGSLSSVASAWAQPASVRLPVGSTFGGHLQRHTAFGQAPAQDMLRSNTLQGMQQIPARKSQDNSLRSLPGESLRVRGNRLLGIGGNLLERVNGSALLLQSLYNMMKANPLVPAQYDGYIGKQYNDFIELARVYNSENRLQVAAAAWNRTAYQPHHMVGEGQLFQILDEVQAVIADLTWLLNVSQIIQTNFYYLNTSLVSGNF